MIIGVKGGHGPTKCTETKDFVLYSKVSFAQGVVADHAASLIVISYDRARLWTMKTIVLIIDLSTFSS